MGRKILVSALIIVSVCGVPAMAASASTPEPTIKSFSPTSGIAGTTEVTINGTNLAHAPKVTFNGKIATVISDTGTKIKAKVPAEATTGYIKVKTAGGTAKSVSKFTVVLDSSKIATTPASPSIGVGYGNSASAVVRGNATYGSPTGTVTFYECGPTASPELCTSQANQVGSPVGVTAGANDTSSASSVSFTASAAGYWCFAGYYSGDSNYAASSDTTTDGCFDVYTPLDHAMSVVSDYTDGYCGLLTSSGVDCWGYGQQGELGNGTSSDSASPVAVEGVGGIGTLTGVTSLVSGVYGYCALLTSGGVDCWGYGPYGELGNGTFSDSGTPVAVEGVGGTGTLTGVASLSGGDDDYCARLTAGGVDCWGYGVNGQLGNGTFYTSSPYGSATPVAVEGVGGTGTLAGVASVLVGGDNFCALLTSGRVDCWGSAGSGALGNGAFSDSATPVVVEGVGGTGTLTGVTSLASDVSGYCALLTSDGVDCWGGGYYGQLGNGTFYTTGNYGSATPVVVEGVGGTGTLTGVTSLFGGGDNYCALLTSGGVDCWGEGWEDGELGNGGFSDSATPVAVEGVGGTGTLTGVTKLVSGQFGYCALLTSGGVDCWGYGTNGQLGNGTFNAGGSATPVEVEGVGGTGTLTGVTNLVSGNVNYCALLTSGGVDCWGDGEDGDLGNGTFYRTSPYGAAAPVEVG